MSDLAVTNRVEKVELDANAVLKEAWRLYKRLLVRSVLMGAAVFGAVNLVSGLSRSGHGGAALQFATLGLTLAGVALLQGGLVEIVRGLHDDGDADQSFGGVFSRSAGRIGTLVAVALLTGIGVAFGLLLLVVPGLVLATRWAVAVPVAMFEPVSATAAMKRSREIVRGNEWAVFKVLGAVFIVTLVVTIPFALASHGMGLFGWWVAVTIGSALTAPYGAHTLTVIYYGLVDPQRPIVLEPGQRWQSVWNEQDASPGEEPPPDQTGGSSLSSDVWAEYEQKFR